VAAFNTGIITGTYEDILRENFLRYVQSLPDGLQPLYYCHSFQNSITAAKKQDLGIDTLQRNMYHNCIAMYFFKVNVWKKKRLTVSDT